MKDIHMLGKRDMAIEMLMAIVANDGNVAKVIKQIATQILIIEKTNPHAKWVLSNIK